MSDIDFLQLRRLDITQLIVFSGLLRHRKMTTVAEEMGLTQSAISHALGRLRETFGDDLFLRTQSGVEPTARALELESSINELLRLASEVLSAKRSFDPMVDERVVRIAGREFETAIFSGPIVELLRREAPLMRVSFKSLSEVTSLKGLETNQHDLAIGPFNSLDGAFEKLSLFEDSYVVVTRANHALAAGTVGVDDYLKSDHLVISPNGSLRDDLDRELDELDLKRKIVAAFPLYLPALTAVASSDLVATLPKRFADRFADGFGLIGHRPPIELRPFVISAVWHRRLSSDLCLKWLCERLVLLAE